MKTGEHRWDYADKRYAGPCVSCGATDYALSCGGATICPRCDAGHPPSSEEKKLSAMLLRAYPYVRGDKSLDACMLACEIERMTIGYPLESSAKKVRALIGTKLPEEE